MKAKMIKKTITFLAWVENKCRKNRKKLIDKLNKDINASFESFKIISGNPKIK